MTSSVRIVEVGPRDGLQNEPIQVETSIKLELIRRLKEAGLKHIEATSFVSPKWVPQMADHAEIIAALKDDQSVAYPVLVPNMLGLAAAANAGAREVAVFAAASDAFSQKNINCSVADSLIRIRDVVASALHAGLSVRGYVSCVIACPYDGPVAPIAVAEVAAALYRMGCYEVSLGDTTGAGSSHTTGSVIREVAEAIPVNALAGHFHDTNGRALESVRAAFDLGVRSFDTSVAGLGGCPYAPGAKGNLATEKLVSYFASREIKTGVDMNQLRACGEWISKILDKPGYDGGDLRM